MRNLFFIISLLILLGSELSGQNNDNESFFTGTWHSTKKPFPYGADIEILPDHTFHFRVGACTFRSFSEGSWKIIDSILILDSYALDSCMLANYFGFECIPVDSFPEPVSTIPGCIPEYSGMEYTIFDDEKFFFKDDTLRHIIRKKNTCPHVKNDYIKVE
ncbi:MAG: hypothetical protein ACOYXB_08255 [Bacteroidota bacterium]